MSDSNGRSLCCIFLTIQGLTELRCLRLHKLLKSASLPRTDHTSSVDQAALCNEFPNDRMILVHSLLQLSNPSSQMIISKTFHRIDWIVGR